ncbi:ribosome biogenesis protein SLX9 domain-containing protein [Trichoderma velutinum]
MLHQKIAPQKPSATALRHARITNSIHPLAPQKTFRADASTTDSFLSSKRDKRTIKHSSFVSRISSSRVSKSSKLRRGRGAKKSTTLNSLDSLADALPELADGEGAAEILDGKIKHQSLRSKKGALKRKERLLKGEMARFGVSMAQLSHLPAQTQNAIPESEKPSAASLPASSGASAPTPAPAPSNRWAALRGYISATMEQNPAFVNKN